MFYVVGNQHWEKNSSIVFSNYLRGPTQLAERFSLEQMAEVEILNLDSPNPNCQCEAMGRVRENRLWPVSTVTSSFSLEDTT